jgi:hypothetical protein
MIDTVIGGRRPCWCVTAARERLRPWLRLVDVVCAREPVAEAMGGRATASLADLDLLLELAPAVPHAGYRDGLLDHALGAAGLPPDRIAAAHRLRSDHPAT